MNIALFLNKLILADIINFFEQDVIAHKLYRDADIDNSEFIE